MRFKFNRSCLSECFPHSNSLKYHSKCALLILYDNKLIPCHVQGWAQTQCQHLESQYTDNQVIQCQLTREGQYSVCLQTCIWVRCRRSGAVTENMEICGNNPLTRHLAELNVGPVHFTEACQLPVNVKLMSLLPFPL